MTINQYQQECLRTVNKNADDNSRLLEGLMGLNGESGECIDLLKKHMFQGHDLDVRHLLKELGDVSWSLAVSADALGYDLETVFQMNVEKRNERYPEKFDPELSIHRKEGDI